jgi:glutamate:GABA antiporter
MAVIESSDLKTANQVSLASEEYVVKAMPPILGSIDMTTTYLLIIFFITNATTAVVGGAAAFTYLIIGALTFFIPCAIATAQLGHMFPHEGSLYNWTHRALGGYWSFFVAFCAWLPGVLVMISAGDVIVTFIQGLNPGWLTDLRAQGAVIIVVIVFSGLLAIQRYRTVQNIINITAALTGVAVLLIGLAGIVWLARGHHSLTNFALSKWSIDWRPAAGNLNLFGLITLAYLGVEAAMNMGGEIAGRHVVKRHIFWGSLFVLIGYFVAAFSLLVVEGPANGSATQFALVRAVDASLGKSAGSIAALCIMAFFVVSAAVYNLAYARLLLVAGIDQRLPTSLGKLNKNRVPANAIMFQTIVAAVIAGLIFFIVPAIPGIGAPVNLSVEVYNIMLAASTLVWAASTAFLFINLGSFLLKGGPAIRQQLIVPLPVIWACIVLGSITCLLAIVGTLFYSWTPLIPNGNWLYIIGGLTIVCLVVAAIGSMLASSEAAWQGVSNS